jgi:hypothetical protein
MIVDLYTQKISYLLDLSARAKRDDLTLETPVDDNEIDHSEANKLQREANFLRQIVI